MSEAKKSGKMPSPEERSDLYDDYDNPERPKSSVQVPDDVLKRLEGDKTE